MVIGLVAIVGVIVACQPVTHPTFVVVEPPDGVVRLLDLSADGRFAVVKATGAGQTVPGPGLWRVDRHDGTALALPSGSTFRKLSRDGRRVQVVTNGSDRLWTEGGVIDLDPGTVMSSNLLWGINTSLFSRNVWRRDIAAGTHARIDAPYPRPPETPQVAEYNSTTTRNAYGISDDGQIIWFGLSAPNSGQCVVSRLIDLVAGQADDVPCVDVVSTDGARMLRGDPQYVAPNVGVLKFNSATVIDRASGATVISIETAHAFLYNLHLADDGRTLWAVDYLFPPPYPPVSRPCGSPGYPPCNGLSAVEVLAATPQSTVHFAASEPDMLLTEGDWNPSRVDMSPNGRFFAYLGEGNDDPLHVLDRLTGQDEILTGRAMYLDVPSPPRSIGITSDGRTIASTSLQQDGWYEFLAA